MEFVKTIIREVMSRSSCHYQGGARWKTRILNYLVITGESEIYDINGIFNTIVGDRNAVGHHYGVDLLPCYLF
jgi:hypothetical protein